MTESSEEAKKTKETRGDGEVWEATRPDKHRGALWVGGEVRNGKEVCANTPAPLQLAAVPGCDPPHPYCPALPLPHSSHRCSTQRAQMSTHGRSCLPCMPCLHCRNQESAADQQK